MDTAGFVNTEVLLEVAKYTDLFLFDLKHMDSALHKKYTGVPNEKILENLKFLAEYGSNINIRVPLIEGVNADEKNIEAMAAFVASLPGDPKPVNLLPYHNIASKKYEKLGVAYNSGRLREPGKSRIANCIGIFEKLGLKATVGG